MSAPAKLIKEIEKLQAQKDEILSKVEGLDEKIAGLEYSIRVLGGTPPKSVTKSRASAAANDDGKPMKKSTGRRARSGKTMKEVVIEVLTLNHSNDYGLKPRAIRDRAKDVLGEEVKPTTLSQTLGILKKEGLVDNSGGNGWRLVKK